MLIFIAIAFFIVQILYIKYSGSPVAVPTIPREPQVIGEGTPLKYAVLGDSTAVSQGSEYEKGIARLTALHLAKTHQVTLQNFAVSGARIHDVLKSQTDQAVQFNPDIVLISVGANDVTHVTRLHDFKTKLEETIRKLKAPNPAVRIILTGSPQIGSVPRLPQPMRYFARLRSAQINDVVDQISRSQSVGFARIADRTGSVFDEDRTLFAADNFHPNEKGYAAWIPTLTDAIDDSLKADQE